MECSCAWAGGRGGSGVVVGEEEAVSIDGRRSELAHRTREEKQKKQEATGREEEIRGVVGPMHVICPLFPTGCVSHGGCGGSNGSIVRLINIIFHIILAHVFSTCHTD
jgi:hypothetical protein